MNQAFINHLMDCQTCYAAAGKYCDKGWQQKTESDADHVASIPRRDDRTRMMGILKKSYGDRFENLEVLVRQKFNELLQERNRDKQEAIGASN